MPDHVNKSIIPTPVRQQAKSIAEQVAQDPIQNNGLPKVGGDSQSDSNGVTNVDLTLKQTAILQSGASLVTH